MRRYHAEKHIIERRIRQHRRVNAAWMEFGSWVTQEQKHEKEAGRYRKTLRCGGCGRSRCQICHSDKYPKRVPTRQEEEAQAHLQEQKWQI